MAMELDSKPKKQGGFARRRSRPGPNMNVTPLVDVVLVLLIIFMAIMPLLTKQFWLHLPNPVERPDPEPADDSDKPIVVTVTQGGDIKINRDVIDKERFQGTLTRVLAAKQQRTVFFDAEDDAPFGAAVEAMDLARAGGATTIAVVTNPLTQR